MPDQAKPWVYWWWLNGNVDEPTITRDLEAMRRLGVGGLLLFDARGYHDDQNHVRMPPSRMDFMSPAWRQFVRFSLAEANRLGLQVSLNLSSCAGALKGPWEVGPDAPKQLVWNSTVVEGPRRFTWQPGRPPGNRSWDVALLAVRQEQPTRISVGSNGWGTVVTALGSQPTATEVLILSNNVDPAGTLTWEAPPGRWTLLRFCGVTMAGHEYDVDILDPAAVAGHFNRMGKAILADAGPLAGKTLTHFYSVSWEGAVPTWTPSLEQEFFRRRGYSLTPWLPVLAGLVVNSPDQSERFLHDFYRTLSDAFQNNFYGTMRTLCHSAGLEWHSESGGPWNRKLPSFAEADQLAFLGQNDMPQGEFWFTGYPVKRRQEMNRPQAMAAHIYGRQLAASEAFTHMVQHWSAYPAALKPFADAAFCDGVNHFIWHTFTCSPPEFGLPGSEYFAGTHLNPNVTWFPQAGPFITYLGRCQFLLRQGQSVNDVAVYIGDRPYQHWGRGTNWSERATLSLPRGYGYDLITTDVLLERLSVSDGAFKLPDGTTYHLLVVDPHDRAVPPAALRQIARFRQSGASVLLGRRQPDRALGLSDYPAADREVQRLANVLWQNGPALKEALQAKLLPPDVEGPCDYTHRRVAGTDIYFLSGQGNTDCIFRVKGRLPELWDAVNGRLSRAANWRMTDDGRTLVSLALPENGSVFVVFRELGQPPPTSPPIPPKVVETILEGPWTVSFESGHGAPPSAVFEQLSPWDKHPDAGIRFFSGRATYRHAFNLTESQARCASRLQLGEVHSLAQVRLNGQDLGIVWTAPWSVDLAGAIKPGRNELEIDIVNTWVNRLIGDAGLPEKKRLTRTNVALQQGPRTLKAYQGFASEDPLPTSGLLGPVRLESHP